MWHLLCAATALLIGQAAASATTANNLTPITTFSASTTTTAPTAPTLQVDVVFPRINNSYAFSSSFPLVFAFQNLHDVVQQYGSFWFSWNFVPTMFGWSYTTLTTINVTEDSLDQFTVVNGSTYLWINNTDTNTSAWDWTVRAGIINPINLQLYLQWDRCGPVYNIVQNYSFNIYPTPAPFQLPPDPSTFTNVTGNCAELGAVLQVVQNVTSTCPAVQILPSQSANSCAVNLNAAEVSSISSVAAAMLVTASASSTTPAASPTTKSNLGYNVAVPTQNVLLAVGILGGIGCALS